MISLQYTRRIKKIGMHVHTFKINHLDNLKQSISIVLKSYLSFKKISPRVVR